MTRLAGMSPAGALIVRAGEPKAIIIVMTDSVGTPQDMSGRDMQLVVRYREVSTPLPTLNEGAPIAADISMDGLAVHILLSGADASAIHAAGVTRALSYDLVEATGGGVTTRWTGRVAVVAGPEVGDAVPLFVELPASQLVIRPDIVVVSERGVRGRNWAEQLYDAGEIENPTMDAVDARAAAQVQDIRDRLGNAESLAETLKEVGLRGEVGAVSSWQMAQALDDAGRLQDIMDALPADPTDPVARRWHRNAPIKAGDVLAIWIAATLSYDEDDMIVLFAAAAAI